MTVYVDDLDLRLLHGDVLEQLATLPDESVHCVVTSPPYWGLRDYGTGEWDGGDADCEHKQDIGARASSGLNGSLAHKSGDVFTPYRDVCGKCGARRVDRQIGLEATPDAYVARMVDVFRQVRRVLRSDGTCWLNLGDSYATRWGSVRDSGRAGYANNERRRQGRFNERSSGGSGNSDMDRGGGLHRNTGEVGSPGRGKGRHQGVPAVHSSEGEGDGRRAGFSLKEKDLVGIPWRVAFALQADGWYLRSDVIWAKPNPMPESVTDRPTKAHEYVFLLTKSARYFYDADAIREAADPASFRSERGPATGTAKHAALGKLAATTPIGRTCGVHESGRRNARSVWQIATQPYAAAHFATFPIELPRRCILAGSPVGGLVLDPFMGSGTTALVARQHGRRSIGIELNADYCRLAADRLQQLSLLTEGAA